MFAPARWHEGKEWERFLTVYDKIAKEQFETSQLVTSRFGETQIHTCGDPKDPPLVFFHGISSNSLMFGEWLFPRLSKDYYCIALDTLGDIGRSLPRGGDPANGPHDDQEMADWAVDVLNQMLPSENQRFSVLGYSFGAYIGTCVARCYPQRLEKLVMLAPAGVVAPVRKAWLAQAIWFAIVSRLVQQDSIIAERLRLWFFGSMMADVESMKNLRYPELRQATDATGSPKVNVQPVDLDVATLRHLTQSTPILLVIGKQESVIDPDQAVDVAKQAGMDIRVYDRAGHMFFCEHPREVVIDEILLFLSNK